MTDKYAILPETDWTGQARRIQALKDFVITLYMPDGTKQFVSIRAGDKGGFVESPNNLSQTGTCWVGGNARALENSRISESGYLYGSAVMSGNSWLHGQARMFDNARATDTVEITDYANACANSRLHGRARLTGWATMGDFSGMHDDACAKGWAYIGKSSQLMGRVVVSGKATKNALCLHSMPFQANFYDTQMMIAGILQPYTWWSTVDPQSLASTDSRLPAFWSTYKNAILTFAAADGRA